MSRKMQTQNAADTQVQDDAPFSTAIINLVVTVTAMAVIVAMAITMLLIAPANATETPRPGPEQLTLWTEELPSNFQVTAAEAGLDVVGIERLVNLGSHIVVVQSLAGQSHEQVAQMLSATFPAMTFEAMNGTEESFELIEN